MSDINQDILNRIKNDITEDEMFIMGRPNFTLANIANRLRTIGVEIKSKSEDEQAVVIYTMLQFYKEYGADWREKINQFLKDGIKSEQP